MSDESLRGLCLVVTRPEQQNKSLLLLLAQHGATALPMPTIAIQALTPEMTVLSRVQYNMVIFISANAVHYGLPLLQQQGLFSSVSACQVAAVGQQTANTLGQAGCPPAVIPEHCFNSEALLQLDALRQVAGKNILIVRGKGGRELLATTLRERGATVDYLEVYQRTLPNKSYSEIMQRGRMGLIHGIITTSNEGLKNLVKIGSHEETWLFHTQLLVLSQRGGNLALELGFTRPAIVADQASDQGILDAVVHWAARIGLKKGRTEPRQD